MREGTRSLPLRRIPPRKPDIQPREGLRLGRYELVLPIAQGGMAEVWVARLIGDVGFTRIFALKTIRPEYAEDASFRRGFFEEARIAALLSHANVLEVLDLGEEGTLLFQVMRLIEGDSVSKLLRLRQESAAGAGLPITVAVRVMIDALAGLHAAHELTDEDGTPMQLVHRDVSPQNILVGTDGVARLGDFGVAKALGRLVDETDAGQIQGKPGYLAPEQIARRPLDRRTDVFAAGIVLWEVITGKRLFRSEEGRPAVTSLGASAVPDPRVFCDDGVPPRIAEATMRALAVEPGERFPTAEALSMALEEAARASGGPASTREVATLVSELCADRIATQRQKIRRAARLERFDEFITRPGDENAARLVSARAGPVTPRVGRLEVGRGAATFNKAPTAVTDHATARPRAPSPRAERRPRESRLAAVLSGGIVAASLALAWAHLETRAPSKVDRTNQSTTRAEGPRSAPQPQAPPILLRALDARSTEGATVSASAARTRELDRAAHPPRPRRVHKGRR